MRHREFLVRVDIDTGAESDQRVAELRTVEAKRTSELVDSGRLAALWKVPEMWAYYGIWRAHDTAELNHLLDSLPLRPFMTVDIQPLNDHPSDPRNNKSTPEPARQPPEAQQLVRRWALPALPDLNVRHRAEATAPRQSRHWTLPPLEPLQLRRRANSHSGIGLARTRVTPIGNVPAGGAEPMCVLSIDVEITPIEAEQRDKDSELFDRVLLNAVFLLTQRAYIQRTEPERMGDIDVLVHTRGTTARVIRQANRLTAAGLLSALRASPTPPDVSMQHKPSLELTHSGAHGFRSYAPAGSTAAAALDVGAITTEVAVRDLPDGDQGIGLRRGATLTLGLPPSETSLSQAASFLQALRSRLASSDLTSPRSLSWAPRQLANGAAWSMMRRAGKTFSS
jgi:muconolactone D-isomerase